MFIWLSNLCWRKFNIARDVRLFSTAISQTKDVGIDNIREKDIEWNDAKSFDSIPGPKPLPILGNFWRFLPGIGTYGGMEPHEISISNNREYGDIVRVGDLLFGNDMVNCYHPKDIEKVYRNEGPWPKREMLPSLKYYRYVTRKDLFQGYGGIFTVDGEEWYKARSVLNPILMKPQTVKLYTEPVSKVADEFIEKVKFLAKNNENKNMPTDLMPEINKWALESMCIITLDIKLGLLDLHKKPDQDVEKFIKANLIFFDLLFDLDMKPSLWKYISTPTWRQYVRNLNEMNEFVMKHIDDALRKVDKNDNEQKDGKASNIFQKLLKLEKRVAFGTIIDMMFGGVDTTSRIVSAWLYYMAANPEIQAKVHEEVKSVLTTLDAPLTSQDLEKMPYFRASLKETMRLAPISIGHARITNSDLVLSGYQVPKGTKVIVCYLASSYKDEYFPQADKFIPNRWLRNSSSKKSDTTSWLYHPFGFGSRACIGKRLAMLEMEILLSKMVRNFKMEWHQKPMTFKSRLMYGVADPLRIKFTPIEM